VLLPWQLLASSMNSVQLSGARLNSQPWTSCCLRAAQRIHTICAGASNLTASGSLATTQMPHLRSGQHCWKHYKTNSQQGQRMLAAVGVNPELQQPRASLANPACQQPLAGKGPVPLTFAVLRAFVSMKPGATSSTCIPRGEHSTRSASDKRMTAALVAEYIPLQQPQRAHVTCNTAEVYDTLRHGQESTGLLGIQVLHCSVLRSGSGKHLLLFQGYSCSISTNV
jgi:hypothetical protein